LGSRVCSGGWRPGAGRRASATQVKLPKSKGVKKASKTRDLSPPDANATKLTTFFAPTPAAAAATAAENVRAPPSLTGSQTACLRHCCPLPFASAHSSSPLFMCFAPVTARSCDHGRGRRAAARHATAPRRRRLGRASVAGGGAAACLPPRQRLLLLLPAGARACAGRAGCVDGGRCGAHAQLSRVPSAAEQQQQQASSSSRPAAAAAAAAAAATAATATAPAQFRTIFGTVVEAV
jgi:hypothetical protein